MGHTWKAFSIGSTTLATMAFSGFLLFAGTPQVKADDCQERIRHADHELHKAAKRHGWDSPQAQERRQQLREAREYCWQHGNRWWDEDTHRWRSDRDWDDHDHDRDHH
jgi:hypothetical protein